MIIIKKGDNEPIDKMLKRYKRKHRQIKQQKEVRRRKEFVKPSVRRRFTVLKAVYIQEKYGNS